MVAAAQQPSRVDHMLRSDSMNKVLLSQLGSALLAIPHKL